MFLNFIYYSIFILYDAEPIILDETEHISRHVLRCWGFAD